MGSSEFKPFISATQTFKLDFSPMAFLGVRYHYCDITCQNLNLYVSFCTYRGSNFNLRGR